MADDERRPARWGHESSAEERRVLRESLRRLQPIPWERARLLPFPYNVPGGADEEADELRRRLRLDEDAPSR